MVVFVCSTCGESLKKNQVEKHCQFKCRNCEMLSCVDCQKEFWGSTYIEHTKCVTEEEKYSGKDWKPKANFHKGEQKQEAWVEQVAAAVRQCQAQPKLRALLQRIEHYPNVPRKKAKFENFVKNSMGERNPHLVSEAWDVILANMPKKEEPKADKETTDTAQVTTTSNTEGESTTPEVSSQKKKKKTKSHTQENGEESSSPEKKKRKRKDPNEEETIQNGTTEDVPKKKKKTKHKQIETEEETPSIETTPAVDTDNSGCPFKWKSVIIGTVRDSNGQTLSVKKLQKKVLKEFRATGGDGNTYTDEALKEKFMKTLQKHSKLQIVEKMVELIS